MTQHSSLDPGGVRADNTRALCGCGREIECGQACASCIDRRAIDAIAEVLRSERTASDALRLIRRFVRQSGRLLGI